MKNKQTETKLRPGIGPTRHLISGVLCLAVISLICARASAQNLFMTDGATIYQFTPDAVRTTFASGLSRAFGLTFDSEGNLFVVNHDNSSSGQILKFTRDGLRNTFALGLNNPGNLAFDSAGNLFTVDTGGIYKFTPNGVRSTFASGLPFPEFDKRALFDTAGNLFVADDASGAIYKFTPTGVQTTFASGLKPLALAFDSRGNLFVGDLGFGNLLDHIGSVYKFTPTGVRTKFASGLYSPVALAFDSRGNLLVADGGMDAYDYFIPGAVYKFAPSGLRSTIASDIVPNALAIDSADNLFVSSSGYILKFTPSGVRTTFASGTVTALAFQPTPTPTAGMSDFNGDGHPDYVLANASTGQTAIWYLNNNVLIRGAFGPTLPAGWGWWLQPILTATATRTMCLRTPARVEP